MNNFYKKQNLQTVTYTISEIGFKYHTVKGEFCAFRKNKKGDYF